MISIDNVSKAYRTVKAVKGVSFTVPGSASTALLGPNGAGKTTIVKMLLDFTSPDTGKVSINNTPCYDSSSRSGIGYMPESINMPGHLTGYGFVVRNALLYGNSKEEAHNRADEALELVEMKADKKKRCSDYSKGMRQRVGLAAALVNRPKVLILDEPVAGLDPVGVRMFRNILLKKKQEKTTILLNSHILSEAEKICDNAVILNKRDIPVNRFNFL